MGVDELTSTQIDSIPLRNLPAQRKRLFLPPSQITVHRSSSLASHKRTKLVAAGTENTAEDFPTRRHDASFPGLQLRRYSIEQRFQPRPCSRQYSGNLQCRCAQHRERNVATAPEMWFSTSLRDARAKALAARDQMIQRARDAWKRPPVRDAAEPDQGSRPEERMRRHLRTEEGAEAQARRDAAWAAYRDRLGNAWRMGRVDPGAASAIERQGERWRGGR